MAGNQRQLGRSLGVRTLKGVTMDGFSQDFPTIATSNYSQIRDTIKTGDLLFASGNSLMSSMIKGATNSVWSHVAFIIQL